MQFLKADIYTLSPRLSNKAKRTRTMWHNHMQVSVYPYVPEHTDTHLKIIQTSWQPCRLCTQRAFGEPEPADRRVAAIHTSDTRIKPPALLHFAGYSSTGTFLSQELHAVCRLQLGFYIAARSLFPNKAGYRTPKDLPNKASFNCLYKAMHIHGIYLVVITKELSLEIILFNFALSHSCVPSFQTWLNVFVLHCLRLVTRANP